MSTSLNKLYLKSKVLDDDTTQNRFKSNIRNHPFDEIESSTDVK